MRFDFIVTDNFIERQAATAAELMDQNKRLLDALLKQNALPDHKTDNKPRFRRSRK